MDGYLLAQKNEITEYHIYLYLSRRVKGKNGKILEQIAKDELRHYHYWKKTTKQEIAPDWLKVHWYVFLSRVFGLSFGLRLMEKGEELIQDLYEKTKFADKILKEEQQHEETLLGMLKETRLEYAGSIVLGLNDALVELTGALAGLTFAFGSGKIIALSGLVTGIAASMSMAASGYLQSKEEAGERNPLTSALYTGCTYIITVLLLVLPYLLMSNVYHALTVMLCLAVLVIAGYTFYITTAKGLAFTRRFLEMAGICLVVAGISFLVGVVMKTLLGVNI